MIARYRARLSGPLLDRIDLHVNVPAVPWSERVIAARRAQRRRRAAAGFRVNAEIPDGCLDEAIAAARAARRVLKLARTLADLAGEAKVGPGRVAAALEFRGDPEVAGAPR